MGLRDIEHSLPPGFRFHPSDDELVCHYLYKKVVNEKVSEGTMVEVDLHTREPWELPDVAKLSENEWYFFSFRDRKYATGSRTNRATKSGYWKATGKDRSVFKPKTRTVIGMRKTLVFYSGRAPNGMKTSWVMHEFRLENPHMPPRVFDKRKEETVNFSQEKDQQNVGCSSSQMEPSPPMIAHPMGPYGECYDEKMDSTLSFPNVPIQEGHSSSSFLNLALLSHYNFLDFPQEMDSATMIDVVGQRGDVDDGDEYGFMLDVGLENNDIEGIMRF